MNYELLIHYSEFRTLDYEIRVRFELWNPDHALRITNYDIRIIDSES